VATTLTQGPRRSQAFPRSLGLGPPPRSAGCCLHGLTQRNRSRPRLRWRLLAQVGRRHRNGHAPPGPLANRYSQLTSQCDIRTTGSWSVSFALGR
jgi:hypothetical protein